MKVGSKVPSKYKVYFAGSTRSGKLYQQAIGIAMDYISNHNGKEIEYTIVDPVIESKLKTLLREMVDLVDYLDPDAKMIAREDVRESLGLNYIIIDEFGEESYD